MMNNNLKSLAISIFAALIYEVSKYLLLMFISKVKKSPYESKPQPIKKIRLQFYICFLGGIILTFFPELKSDFWNQAIKNTMYFLFFFALMAFMCLDDEFKKLSKNKRNQNTE